MRTLLLGVDIGTSSCKTAVFDPEGRIAAQGGCEYPVSYPRKGWAEQDPELWWDGDRTGQGGESALPDADLD